MKKRLKTLIPCLKERKRYIVFEILSDSKIKNYNVVSNAIKGSIFKYLGELESARAGIKLLPNNYDLSSQRGIIKVNNKYVDKIKSSMLLLKQIDNNKVIIKNICVSGTIKSTKKFFAN